MTKPLATVAVLQQVEAGTLELDAPMTAYPPSRSLELMEVGDDGAFCAGTGPGSDTPQAC